MPPRDDRGVSLASLFSSVVAVVVVDVEAVSFQQRPPPLGPRAAQVDVRNGRLLALGQPAQRPGLEPPPVFVVAAVAAAAFTAAAAGEDDGGRGPTRMVVEHRRRREDPDSVGRQRTLGGVGEGVGVAGERGEELGEPAGRREEELGESRRR